MLMQVLRGGWCSTRRVDFLSGQALLIGALPRRLIRCSIDRLHWSREGGFKILGAAGGASLGPGPRELSESFARWGGNECDDRGLPTPMFGEALAYSIYSRVRYSWVGPNCSALSASDLLEENYDRLLERLIPAAASLALVAGKPGSWIGPVID